MMSPLQSRLIEWRSSGDRRSARADRKNEPAPPLDRPIQRGRRGRHPIDRDGELGAVEGRRTSIPDGAAKKAAALVQAILLLWRYRLVVVMLPMPMDVRPGGPDLHEAMGAGQRENEQGGQR
jgi:hypothetical protein